MELLITSIEHSKIAQLSVLLTQNSIESDFSSETLTIGDPFTSKPIYQYHLYVDAANLEKANSILIDSKLFEDELNDDTENQFDENDFIEDEKGRDLGTLDDFDLPNLSNERFASRAKPYLIIIGYAVAIFGGFIAIAIGGRLYHMKVNDDKGSDVYAYDEYSRNHGLNMMILAGFMILGGIIVFLIKTIS
jgi:hypothetical protein